MRCSAVGRDRIAAPWWRPDAASASLRLMRIPLFVTALAIAASTLTAQSNDLVTRGDSAYAAHRPGDAITHYEAAVAADSSEYEALWKASRSLADLAEYESDKNKRAEMYRRAERLARQAVAVRPDDAEAHF